MPIRSHFCSPAMRAFLSLAESGCIALTAQHLFLTPSAIAKRLRQLEFEMGAKLIDRQSHPLHLTAEGRALLATARRVATLEQTLLSEWSEARPKRQPA